MSHRQIPSRALLVAAAFLVLANPLPTHADENGAEDDGTRPDSYYVQADSRKTVTLKPCSSGSKEQSAGCADGSLDLLARTIEDKLKAALAKAGPTAVPLLKRDAVWFVELIEAMNEHGYQERNEIAEVLKQRAATLDAIAAGFGRLQPVGRWANVFGTVEITPADAGTSRVVVDTNTLYSPDEDRRAQCHAEATVKADATGWLTGDAPLTMRAPADGKTVTAPIRLRLQGNTLRVVTQDVPTDTTASACTTVNQITGTYFALGTPGTSLAKGGTAPFTAPSFDCLTPISATEEEICADPELAANDIRLNRAWIELQPRLDAPTRALLKKDQKLWLMSQTNQFPEFLHPAWAKTQYFMHDTTGGRDKVHQLQRERIAMLEGFDDKRTGLEGLWLAHDAVLNVKRTGKGTLTATGWKWEQGDWKAGCDYEMEGSEQHGTLTSGTTPNPDTLERDGATLIVNRQDDILAPNRQEAENDPKAGSMKCKRNITISSTARLFPVKPSPDIATTSDNIR